jgi:hypothetical protein
MVGDEDVIEDKAGRAAKCGMELRPIRLDSGLDLPVHAAVIKDKPGACPIDAASSSRSPCRCRGRARTRTSIR